MLGIQELIRTQLAHILPTVFVNVKTTLNKFSNMQLHAFAGRAVMQMGKLHVNDSCLLFCRGRCSQILRRNGS